MRYEPGGWGALTSIDVDPSDPRVLVAGADVGGLQSSTDAGRTWVVCTDSAAGAGVESRPNPNRTIATAFILTARFLAGFGGEAARLVVGSSHGVYVGTRAGGHPGPRGCPWSFELANHGLLRGDPSLSPSREQFLHPVSALESSGGALFIGIGVTIGRGPARPRGGDPFSVYTARWGAGRAPNPWTGILTFREPVAIFSLAASASTGQLLVASDRGVFATALVDPGATWLELGVAPAMLSLSRGLAWVPCGGARGADGMATCPPPFEAHNAGVCSRRACLPITAQMNYTHPNARTVAVGKSGAIFVTLWEEGWAPCTSPGGRYLHDPTLEWYNGGPFKSNDGGVTFRSLFRDAINQSIAVFSGATLRCPGQPSRFLTSNWPHAQIDPADENHILLAGWGFGGPQRRISNTHTHHA